MRRWISLCLLPIVVTACALPEVKGSTRDTSWIQPGVTTRQDVIKQLGEPVTSVKLLDEETVHYGHGVDPAQASNVPSVVATARGYVTVTPAYTPDTDALADRPLWIRFDKTGIVTAFGYDEPTRK